MIYSVSNFRTGVRVDQAARDRLHELLTLAPNAHFYVNFSGGKDSTALLSLAIDELPHDQLHVMYYDLESEVPDTHGFVKEVYEWCNKHRIDFKWNWGQWKVRNATWNKGHGLFTAFSSVPLLNIPPYEVGSCPDYGHKTITYCRDRILIEYSDYFDGGGSPVISLIGITKFESLHRLLATTKKRKGNWEGLPYTTIQYQRNQPPKLIIKAYPIFDWRADDVWGYLQENSPWGINPYYDKMHRLTQWPISKIRTENVLHGCAINQLPLIKELYPDFYRRMEERHLIGSDWGNKHAGEGLPRPKSDGRAAAEKWANLL